MEEISITDFAKKKDISRTALKMRLAHRKIKPVRYIGATGMYKEEDMESVMKPLPKGKASPKWGKQREQSAE